MESEKREFERSYYRAHRVVEGLLDAYIRNQESDDREESEKFFRENPYSGQLAKRLSSPAVHRELYDRLQKEDREKNLSRLLERLRLAERQRNKRLVWLRAVASVAAVIAVVLFVWRGGEKDTLECVANYSGQEQYLKPTLILDNDSALVLSGNIMALAGRADGVEHMGENHLRYASEKRSKKPGFNKLVVPRKYTYTVYLADGTEIMLNAGSSLKYPVSFTEDVRKVELFGEAFFKVAKSHRAFVVSMGDCEVKVYGTQFNVYTRPDGDIEVVLLEGSIGFVTEGRPEIEVVPGQLVSFDRKSNEMNVSEVEPQDYILWTENMFVFKNRSLKRILTELEVWHGIKITSASDAENIKLTLIVGKDTPLEEMFGFITEITGIKIIKTGDMEYRTE
ncbi:MAG: FecR domain-containing protein [Oscillibacter sp.]|nr:FecR domain-containing protein [Oscillibacter sp.]